MNDFDAMISASLIVGVTLGCFLGFWSFSSSRQAKGTTSGSGWRVLLSTLVAFGGGTIAGYISGYVSVTIFLIGYLALLEFFPVLVSSIVAIVVACAVGGFLAVMGVLAAVRLVGRLARRTFEPLRWRIPIAEGIGIGFTLEFAHTVSAFQTVAVPLAIAAGLVAALVCGLALRRSRQAGEPIPARS